LHCIRYCSSRSVTHPFNAKREHTSETEARFFHSTVTPKAEALGYPEAKRGFGEFRIC
jgi:hypothetical protein